jgi:hypothetical protein
MRLLRTITLWLLAAVLLVLVPMPLQHERLAQASNVLETCTQLINDVNAGTFRWSGAAQSCANGNVIINRATFVAWISNNGSCASGTNSATYMMTKADMQACAVTITQHTDNSGTVTAYGRVSCNATCTTNGGAPTAAVNASYNSGFTASVTDAAHPVTWSITLSGCVLSGVYIGGTNISTATSGTYSAGAYTGTVSFTVADTGSTAWPASPPSCTASGTLTYYH